MKNNQGFMLCSNPLIRTGGPDSAWRPPACILPRARGILAGRTPARILPVRLTGTPCEVQPVCSLQCGSTCPGFFPVCRPCSSRRADRWRGKGLLPWWSTLRVKGMLGVSPRRAKGRNSFLFCASVSHMIVFARNYCLCTFVSFASSIVVLLDV